MGFKRKIEDAAGVTHNDAYYKVAGGILFNLTRKRCVFSFDVYTDKSARDAGKISLRGVPGPVRFWVDGDEFDQWFSIGVMDEVGKNIISQCYGYGKGKIDDASIIDVDPD
jgi:hypothetical protein